ncbi:unnamed protein product [Pleuronectes platessa]|uniref:Uncharacterized protein n=1 Tax=Pleuronectes platessa TaxID=8262 RepID=A0A9N7YLG8_PLEPL|nr:unnamed protein product [Pleuronectes platessa]
MFIKHFVQTVGGSSNTSSGRLRSQEFFRFLVPSPTSPASVEHVTSPVSDERRCTELNPETNHEEPAQEQRTCSHPEPSEEEEEEQQGVVEGGGKDDRGKRKSSDVSLKRLPAPQRGKPRPSGGILPELPVDPSCDVFLSRELLPLETALHQGNVKVEQQLMELKRPAWRPANPVAPLQQQLKAPYRFSLSVVTLQSLNYFIKRHQSAPSRALCNYRGPLPATDFSQGGGGCEVRAADAKASPKPSELPEPPSGAMSHGTL